MSCSLGEVALIILTGAAGGLGQKIINLLSEIDEIVGIYHSALPEPSIHENVFYEKLDVQDVSGTAEFVKKWKSKFGRLTLVHCAALKIDGFAINYALSDWDQVLGVNLKGNFILTQALLPHMIQEQWGRIIHISSRGGIDGDPGTLAYSTSKAGLIGMSAVLGKEYARYNITSNVLALGTFETGMFLNLSSELKEKIRSKIPSKKFGNVLNIIHAIKFLIDAEYVNATVVNIDGGMS